MHSDPGDFIGQGLDYNYTRPFDQLSANIGFNQSFVHINLDGLNGDHWTLDFGAPDRQPLQVGSYPDAQGWPFMEPGHPGIQVNQGFTCQTITGSFNVLELEVDGFTVNRFHATFEQHCNNAAAALSGEIIYTPQSPLPPLQLTINVDKFGVLDPSGFIKVTGTITCTQHVFATVDVTLRQEPKRAFSINGMPCSPGSAVPWALFADPQGDTFRPGPASTSANVSGKDAFTGIIESAQSDRTVIVRRGTF